MRSGGIMDLAWRHSHWVAQRQSAIAGNIANINTPGFRTHELPPFETAMDQASTRLALTDSRHLQPGGERRTVMQPEPQTGEGLVHSGNGVSLEQQLAASAEAQQAYALDTSVLRAFHRMTMAGLKA